MSVVGATAAGVAVSSVILSLFARRLAAPSWRHPDAVALAAVFPGASLAGLEMTRAGATAAALVVLAPFGLWPLAAAAAFVPSIVLRARLATLRDGAALRSLDVLRATHAALRSGVPLAQALRLAVARCDALASDPFLRALESFDLNVPLDEALRAAARAAHDRRVTVALDALALIAAEQLAAIRSASVVGSVLDRLTFERRLADEVRARTGGVRAQIVLLALLVPALALYLIVSMPGLRATLMTPLATAVLVPAAALLEAAGIVASRAIVRGAAR